MRFTPEPGGDGEAYRSRLLVVLLVAALAIGAAAIVTLPDEIESALSEGCEALPQMADAFDKGDRTGFDQVNDQASKVGFAEFRGADLTDDESVIEDAAVAARAYFTLYDAAYEPAESNNGRSVWRGSELTPTQARDVDAGLAVCEDY